MRYVWLVFLAWSVVRADQPRILTLKEAREIALRNHPTVSRADLEALASQQIVNQVRAAYLPNLTFDSTSVETGNDNTRIAAGRGLSNSAIYERNAEGLTLEQRITDFGRTGHLLAGSRLQYRADEENAQGLRAEIVMRSNVAYFDALRAQSVLAVARQTLDTRKFLLDQVSALAQNGLRSELDRSFASVSYREGRLLVAKAETDLKAAFATLTMLLADRDLEPYELVDDAMPPASPVDPEKTIAEAMTNRPDLARFRLEQEAAEQYELAQRALARPTINLFGSAGVIPFRDDAHFIDHYAAVGVNLSVPVFDGGLNAAKRSESTWRAKAAAERVRDAENTVIHDVRTASMSVNYAFDRLSLTQELFDNASQAFDLAQARYKVGISSIVELSQAQLAKTTAEIAHTGAKYDYRIQLAVLDYETGKQP